MASTKQIEANRQNALRSTGPKTPEGKRNSARNPIRHGIYARELVLPGESTADLMKLHRRVTRLWKPACLEERKLVAELVTVEWRRMRLRRYEKRLLHFHAGAASDSAQVRLNRLDRYETQLRGRWYRAAAQLLARKQSPAAPKPPAAQAVVELPKAA